MRRRKIWGGGAYESNLNIHESAEVLEHQVNHDHLMHEGHQDMVDGGLRGGPNDHIKRQLSSNTMKCPNWYERCDYKASIVGWWPFQRVDTVSYAAGKQLWVPKPTRSHMGATILKELDNQITYSYNNYDLFGNVISCSTKTTPTKTRKNNTQTTLGLIQLDVYGNCEHVDKENGY
jgi:hypothetical protein